MRILNWNTDLNFRANRDWTDARLFKRRYPASYHFVWGRVSFCVDQAHLEEIEVHKECGGEVRWVGPDGIAFCSDCETIVEGETEYRTREEIEN